MQKMCPDLFKANEAACRAAHSKNLTFLGIVDEAGNIEIVENRLSATELYVVELRCWFKEDVLECTQLEVRGFELLGASSSE